MDELENIQLESVIQTVDQAIESFENIARNYKPCLKNDRYYTDQELSVLLKVSRRTLQDWRTAGKIPYINLGGKVLYRESEIEKLLEDNYYPMWEY